MTPLEIFLLFCLAICAILVSIQGIMYDAQQKVLTQTFNRLDKHNEETYVLYDYCLKHIHNEALEKEDYKTCAEVRDMLKRMENDRTGKN